MAVCIKIRKGETLDRSLRRFKRKLDREDVIRNIRSRLYYEKPSVRRRRKREAEAFRHMLLRRYQDM